MPTSSSWTPAEDLAAAVHSHLSDKRRQQQAEMERALCDAGVSTWASRQAAEAGAAPPRAAAAALAWDDLDGAWTASVRNDAAGAASGAAAPSGHPAAKRVGSCGPSVEASPSQLHAAGFAVGRVYSLVADGSLQRSGHAERREARKRARRAAKDHSRAEARDGGTAPAVEAPAAGCAPRMEVDPFHGRPVAVLPRSGAGGEQEMGSKRKREAGAGGEQEKGSRRKREAGKPSQQRRKDEVSRGGEDRDGGVGMVKRRKGTKDRTRQGSDKAGVDTSRGGDEGGQLDGGAREGCGAAAEQSTPGEGKRGRGKRGRGGAACADGIAKQQSGACGGIGTTRGYGASGVHGVGGGHDISGGHSSCGGEASGGTASKNTLRRRAQKKKRKRLARDEAGVAAVEGGGVEGGGVEGGEGGGGVVEGCDAAADQVTRADRQGDPVQGRGSGGGRGGGRGGGAWRKSLCPYGNYDSYYSYRLVPSSLGSGGPVDVRMQAFRRDWFAGRDVCDIGCNAGLVTASVARVFGVRSMLGLDIDAALVAKAKALLASQAHVPHPAATTAPTVSAPTAPAPMLANADFRRLFLGSAATAAPAPAAPSHVGTAAVSGFPLSCAVSLGGAREPIEPFEAGAPFPRCVWFRHCNIVQEPPSEGTPGTPGSCSAYDTVLCLSTSKWVHLHFGDAGLLCLFRRIHDALRPGGRLLLEPQPWSSYRKAAGVAPHVLRNYGRIQIKPPNFRDVLIHQIGFASCEQILMPAAPEAGARAGFAQGARGGSQRPLLLLTKA